MALFLTPEDHAANPPETWEVRRVTAKCWHLTQANNGPTFSSYRTQRDAEEARTSGVFFNLYFKEGRWFAGEEIFGWKPYERKA